MTRHEARLRSYLATGLAIASNVGALSKVHADATATTAVLRPLIDLIGKSCRRLKPEVSTKSRGPIAIPSTLG